MKLKDKHKKFKLKLRESNRKKKASERLQKLLKKLIKMKRDGIVEECLKTV